jgi:hypothetical protein
MFFDMILADRAKCSISEKKECIQAARLIYSLADKARLDGIPALEEEIERQDNPAARNAIKLLILGAGARDLRETVSAAVYYSGLSGKALLENIIIAAGIISIHAGDSLDILKYKMASLLAEAGDDFLLQIEEDRIEEFRGYLKGLDDVNSLSAETELLEELLIKKDNKTIQKMLQQADSDDLCLSLSGASGKSRKRVLENVSEKVGIYLTEKIAENSGAQISEIVKAQKRIIKIFISIGKKKE